MAFEFPITFRSEYENYITALPLNLFAKEHKTEKLKPGLKREEMINQITLYANQDGKKEKEVCDWVDKVLGEGRKEVYLYLFDVNPFTIKKLKDDNFVSEKIESVISTKKRNIIGNRYDKDYKIVNYEIKNTEQGRIISITMCKLIYSIGKTGDNRTQFYPATVSLYVDKGVIVSKVKSKADMVEYDQELLNAEKIKLISSEKQAKISIDKVMSVLEFDYSKDLPTINLKRKLYEFVDKCTKTPLVIEEHLQQKEKEILVIANNIIIDICNIDNDVEKDVYDDLRNLTEKYLSITRRDMSIFTENRIAYPIKISATDDAFCKVSQISGLEEPLQSKAIFFDNKKMLQNTKKCDWAQFSFARKNKKYTSERYAVGINIKNKYCLFKFYEYTEGVDIDEVLFSVI